jgi:acetolactate synthase-1/3 small subunit
MVLLKVNAEDSKRAEILRIVDIFRCKVVDVSVDELTIEVTGDQGKIGALVNLLTRFGIKEIARTGNVAMQRSMQIDL